MHGGPTYTTKSSLLQTQAKGKQDYIMPLTLSDPFLLYLFSYCPHRILGSWGGNNSVCDTCRDGSKMTHLESEQISTRASSPSATHHPLNTVFLNVSLKYYVQMGEKSSCISDLWVKGKMVLNTVINLQRKARFLHSQGEGALHSLAPAEAALS